MRRPTPSIVLLFTKYAFCKDSLDIGIVQLILQACRTDCKEFMIEALLLYLLLFCLHKQKAGEEAEAKVYSKSESMCARTFRYFWYHI
jgi:hypothetical protein